MQLRACGWQGQALTAALVPFGLTAGIKAAIDAGSLPRGSIMIDARTLRIRERNAEGALIADAIGPL